MKVSINGILIRPDTVAIRGLGFGQKDVVTIPIQVELTKPEFDRAAREPFNSFVEECKVDDARTGGNCSVLELVSRAYPTYDALLLKDDVCLCSLITKYNYDSLLESLFGDNSPDGCDHAVNSLERITHLDDGFLLEGQAYVIR